MTIPAPKFKKGDKVTLVNDYGCIWENHTIVKEPVWEEFDNGVSRWVYYVDTDAPWSPWKESNVFYPSDDNLNTVSVERHEASKFDLMY